MTDRGPQFLADEAGGRRRGEADFEDEMARLGIRHVLAGAFGTQTSGKIRRFRGVLGRHLREFEAGSPRTATRSDLPRGRLSVGGPFHHAQGPQDAVPRLVE